MKDTLHAKIYSVIEEDVIEDDVHKLNTLIDEGFEEYNYLEDIIDHNFGIHKDDMSFSLTSALRQLFKVRNLK